MTSGFCTCADPTSKKFQRVASGILACSSATLWGAGCNCACLKLRRKLYPSCFLTPTLPTPHFLSSFAFCHFHLFNLPHLSSFLFLLLFVFLFKKYLLLLSSFPFPPYFSFPPILYCTLRCRRVEDPAFLNMYTSCGSELPSELRAQSLSVLFWERTSGGDLHSLCPFHQPGKKK